MDKAPMPEELPANLKFLRRLVTVLTAVMIVGLVTIVSLLVMRLSNIPAPPPSMLALPDTITLPEGVRATAFTQGETWYAIVTDDDRILLFDRTSNTLRKEIALE